MLAPTTPHRASVFPYFLPTQRACMAKVWQCQALATGTTLVFVAAAPECLTGAPCYLPGLCMSGTVESRRSQLKVAYQRNQDKYACH
mmetsp:Transcript_61861/g.98015  ORF Transcript_61861/g.98015 Transcript_61861/m.98015 type:complete len:87 (+) Transcript_61861:81-341(+)